MHRSKNSAVAVVKGGKDYPRLMGKVYFNQTPHVETIVLLQRETL